VTTSGLWRRVVAVLALCLPACEDPSQGAGCEPQECGGDVTGTWTVESACAVGPDVVSPECPDWACWVESVAASGTLSFEQGGAAEIAVGLELTTRCSIPRACVASCAAAASGPYGHLSCVESGETCDCSQVDDAPLELTGTWEVTSGSYLSLEEPPDRRSGTSSFCVTGSTLSMGHLASRDLMVPGAPVASLIEMVMTGRRIAR
jgi:hypothetical protein